VRGRATDGAHQPQRLVASITNTLTGRQPVEIEKPGPSAAFASRLRFVTAILAVLLIGAASPVVAGDNSPAKPAAAEPADWPAFRHDQKLRGVASSTLPDQLELLWKHDAGEMVSSTAAIVGGRVYIGSLKGEVLCLDLRTGKRIWTYRSIEDPDPKAFAPGFKSSATVTADSVYLGDEDGVFHALDRATGKKRWTFKTDAEIVSSATPFEDKVIFGSHDNSLYCLKTADGSQVWKFVTQGPVNCTPAVIGTNTFVTGCDEHLRVIDIATAKEQTDIPLGTYLIASPAVVDNVLYVGTYASEVVAVDWKTQAKLWTYKDPEREFPYHSSAAVSDKYVIVGSRDKRVHAIDRQTGKGLWVFNTRGKVDSSPVIVGDRVFVGSQDGNLYGLRLSDGKELWKFTDGKPFTASPAVGEGCLVIGSESSDGHIYCFGKK
jgi:outer membrane protein assembly factor BamB